MNGEQIVGVIILVFGLIWLIFGEQQLKKSGKEGIILKLFEVREEYGWTLKLIRWGGGVAFVGIGLSLILGCMK